jgi:hypothetical protein
MHSTEGTEEKLKYFWFNFGGPYFPSATQLVALSWESLKT